MKAGQPALHSSLAAIAAALALCACAGAEKRPVLYPNAHYENVGGAQARHDIDACMQRAESSGVSSAGESKVLERGAQGAAVGGAAAGAASAVRGGNVLRNATAGAAAGAAGGAVHGAFESNKLDPTYKHFVARCLRDRGYDVIGWK